MPIFDQNHEYTPFAKMQFFFDFVKIKFLLS